MPPAYIRSFEEFPSRQALLSHSGLAFMQAMLAGDIPHSPIAEVMNYHLTEVADGMVAFEGRPGLAHTNPVGGVHGGWYGTLLDSALGCAVMTKVPQGRWYTTLEYKVNLTRALPPGTGVVVRGIVDHAGQTTAVAHADIRGLSDGRLYATGTTTCIILG